MGVIEAVFAVPGELATPTGGYAYDRRVMALLPGLDIAVRHVALPGSFPDPTPADLAETARLLDTAPSGSVLVIDSLAFGAMPDALVRRIQNPIVALVHHPLALETGLDSRRKEALLASERQALSHAAAIVATSPMTARLLVQMFGVDPASIAVAVPGVDAVSRAVGSGAEPNILAVGAISPRKGYGDLILALARVRDRPWRAAIIGSPDREPAEAARIRGLISEAGLSDRIALVGAVDAAALARHYNKADLFVLASHFEGYGMVLAEAMVHGLAIVTARGGAAAETVPDDAAVKVVPGDVPALADALRLLLDDGARRRALADAAWRAGQALPRWHDTARCVAGAILRAVRA